MYCKKCGKPLKEDARFCQSCGEKVPAPGSGALGSEKKAAAGQGGSQLRPLIVTLAVIAILIAAAVVLILFSGGRPKTDPIMSNETRESETQGAAKTSIPPETANIEPDSEISKEETQGLTDGQSPDDEALTEAAAGFSAKLMPANQVDQSDLHRLDWTDCGDSSHVVQPKYDNTARAAMDLNDKTSWQEGADGPGIGEQLWYDFGSDFEIRYISFKLGNWRNDHYFYANNRPKKLRLTINGNSTTIEFPSTREEYWVELEPPCTGTRLTITVEDVYKGTGEFDDACIAEIGVYGK